MEDAIVFGMSKLKYDKMRENQRDVVLGYLKGKDIFYCSPTGSGKSFVFEIAPFVFSYMYHSDALPTLTSSVIVISPLVALMRTQVEKLKSIGLRAAYLTDIYDSSSPEISMKQIKSGHFDILVCSPESILGEHRSIVKDLSEKKILKAIFIDEAHCIVKFGKPCPVTKRPAFRPAYGKLGDLRSLAGPSIPVIALTATASFETIAVIKRDLGFDLCLEIVVTPNKPNIKYEIVDVKHEDIRANFKWLIYLLEKHGVDTPRMIIFFRKIEQMSVVYKHTISLLGQKAYINYNEDGTNDDRNRLIDMFHMKTSDVVKSSICKSYEDPKGHIRVVLCTTSFSMGLDVKGVDTVLHYRPANNLEDYLQETGRAGRNLDDKCHAIILKYKRSLGSKNISKSMKAYVNDSVCRRKKLLHSFSVGAEALSPVPAHMCCDICAKLCKCKCNCKTSNCDCEITCDATNSAVIDAIIKSIHSDESSSDESGKMVSDVGFSSESDFEEYLSQRPNVFQCSDDSD